MTSRTVQRQLEIAAEETDNEMVKRRILNALNELDNAATLGADDRLGAGSGGLGA